MNLHISRESKSLLQVYREAAGFGDGPNANRCAIVVKIHESGGMTIDQIEDFMRQTRRTVLYLSNRDTLNREVRRGVLTYDKEQDKYFSLLED